MSLFGVLYEFELSEKNIEHLMGDIGNVHVREDDSGLLQGEFPATIQAQDLLSLLKRRGNIYVGIDNRPGLVLRFSRKMKEESLPHIIEGMRAFVHPSSEGHLDLGEFKTYFEASLSRALIPFTRYDK